MAKALVDQHYLTFLLVNFVMPAGRTHATQLISYELGWSDPDKVTLKRYKCTCNVIQSLLCDNRLRKSAGTWAKKAWLDSCIWIWAFYILRFWYYFWWLIQIRLTIQSFLEHMHDHLIIILFCNKALYKMVFSFMSIIYFRIPSVNYIKYFTI